MDEVDPEDQSVRNYAAQGEASPFDEVLPEHPLKLPSQQKRIPYLSKAGTARIIQLKKENKYNEAIFRACVAGFQSEWFSEISNNSVPSYFESVRFLFDWINESGYTATEQNRYDILRDYEAYQMNNRGLRGSPLSYINIVIREGLSCPTFTSSEYSYLEILISLSKPTKNREPIPISLSSWFDLPWLRAAIGEQAYFQLESPRRIFVSFRVTIATTLLWLLAQRKCWQKYPAISFKPAGPDWQYNWNPMLFSNAVRINAGGDPVGDLSELMFLDLVKLSALEPLKKRLAKSGVQKLPKKISCGRSQNSPWKKPAFFHPEYQNQYSPGEELLCAWLVACEGVQPTDIPKLKTSNYAIEYNRHGRLILMQCTYYKGRAGTIRQPALLMGNEPWAQAMASYIRGLSGPQLFRTDVKKPINFGVSGHGQFRRVIGLLYAIWKLPSFQQQLEAELKKADATSVFLDAMLAFERVDSGNEPTQKRETREEGRYLASLTIPSALFTLTHIKTTAVHARTDVYRDSDLVNYNSHTSITEKTSYLTDANKEWVNQAGRITRLVIHDLQAVVFQPSITAISQSVMDLELRTRVIEETNISDIKVNSLQTMIHEGEREAQEAIIVSDTIDTALYFHHFITQADAMLPKLLLVRPDWVERTLVVQVEWMTRTLSRMKTAAAAQKAYTKLSVHLPSLFDHLIETTE